jgi:hypothetical protein
MRRRVEKLKRRRRKGEVSEVAGYSRGKLKLQTVIIECWVHGSVQVTGEWLRQLWTRAFSITSNSHQLIPHCFFTFSFLTFNLYVNVNVLVRAQCVDSMFYVWMCLLLELFYQHNRRHFRTHTFELINEVANVTLFSESFRFFSTNWCFLRMWERIYHCIIHNILLEVIL